MYKAQFITHRRDVGTAFGQPLLEKDSVLIEEWLKGMTSHTQRANRRHILDFIMFTGKYLAFVTLQDFQKHVEWKLKQKTKKNSTINRESSSLKSLLTFAHRLGVLPFNVGAAIHMLPVKDELASRNVDEEMVKSIIGLETDPRNKRILILYYMCGLRSSELSSLKWRDLTTNGGTGQITVFGRGGKTRSILLTEGTFHTILCLRQ